MCESVEDIYHHLVIGMRGNAGKAAGRLVGQVAHAGEWVEVFPAVAQFRIEGVCEGVCLSPLRLMTAANHTPVCDRAVPCNPFSEKACAIPGLQCEFQIGPSFQPEIIYFYNVDVNGHGYGL